MTPDIITVFTDDDLEVMANDATKSEMSRQDARNELERRARRLEALTPSERETRQRIIDTYTQDEIHAVTYRYSMRESRGFTFAKWETLLQRKRGERP